MKTSISHLREDVQKCYCGSTKCRGSLGEKVSDLAPKPQESPLRDSTSSPRPKKKDSTGSVRHTVHLTISLACLYFK